MIVWLTTKIGQQKNKSVEVVGKWQGQKVLHNPIMPFNVAHAIYNGSAKKEDVLEETRSNVPCVACVTIKV